ncbi:MAG: transcription termination/antitermination protein NusG [Oscillospiraceae bacterium]|jgi:transcriptional antiterminator NusG|nr:transcription termination/antitermination protein NusG [Oscillospiraceae bacterium]
MADSEARWYVVHTYSGYENAVATTVEKAAENRNMTDLIIEVNIPTETVTEVIDGVSKTSERKTYPGYVLIKMVMTDDSWHLVRNVRGVTGFVGENNKAIPLTEEEIRQMNLEKHELVIGYEVGSLVKVIDGPLAGFSGTVDEIEADKSRVKVIVSMFGRETPVDLDFDQIEADKN